MHRRPEDELLLQGVRAYFGTASVARIRALLHGDLEWAYVLRTATQHGVLPLLYKGLHTADVAAVPQPILAGLQEQFRANAVRNVWLTTELLKLLALFATHEIPAIPYKGPVVATALYGHLALRQCVDLDIVVQPRDLLRVQPLLVSQGYRLALTSAQAASFRQHRYHYAFVRTDGKVLVEIHWAFTRKHWALSYDPVHLWARLVSVPLAGHTVRSFHPEDLLLLLCVHGLKDHWARLLWIGDIAALLHRHPDMAWDRVLAQARQWGCQRILLLGLLLARDLLGAALPEQIIQKIQAAPVVSACARRVSHTLFSDTHPGVGDAGYLHLRERFRDKVLYLRHRLPSYLTPQAPDRALLALPAGLLCLYYVLRPLRLVGTHGLAFVRRAWKTWCCRDGGV